MSNRPHNVLYYLKHSKPQLRNYISSANDNALHDLLKRNSHDEGIVCLSVDELYRRKETAGLSRYVPCTGQDVEALLAPAVAITKKVSINPDEALILGGEVRRSEKRQTRFYFDQYTLIKTARLAATFTGYIDHPLAEPFIVLRVKRPFEQELHFGLAQAQLAFASWQIVADQALGLRPISPLPDLSPFQDAAE